MTNKILILAYSLAAFLAMPLLAVPGSVAVSAPLLIAVEDAAAPWSNSDGSGLANEVVAAAFNAAGVDIKFLVVPYARCKDMAVHAKAVACLSMSWLPEFEGKIVFADKPLFVCHTDYFFSKHKPLTATNEQAIAKGSVIGIVNGYEYAPAVYALKDKGTIVLETSASDETNLKKLVRGRVDAVLLNYNESKPAELVLKQAGVLGQVQRGFRSGSLASYIGFSIKSEQGDWARMKFNAGYKIIAGNGVLKKIEQKWVALAQAKIGNTAIRQYGNTAIRQVRPVQLNR